MNLHLHDVSRIEISKTGNGMIGFKRVLTFMAEGRPVRIELESSTPDDLLVNVDEGDTRNDK